MLETVHEPHRRWNVASAILDGSAIEAKLAARAVVRRRALVVAAGAARDARRGSRQEDGS